MMMNFSAREAFSSCCSQQKLRLHYTEKRVHKNVLVRESVCVYVIYKLATARFCKDSFESIREKRLSNIVRI